MFAMVLKYRMKARLEIGKAPEKRAGNFNQIADLGMSVPTLFMQIALCGCFMSQLTYLKLFFFINKILVHKFKLNLFLLSTCQDVIDRDNLFGA